MFVLFQKHLWVIVIIYIFFIYHLSHILVTVPGVELSPKVIFMEHISHFFSSEFWWSDLHLFYSILFNLIVYITILQLQPNQFTVQHYHFLQSLFPLFMVEGVSTDEHKIYLKSSLTWQTPLPLSLLLFEQTFLWVFSRWEYSVFIWIYFIGPERGFDLYLLLWLYFILYLFVDFRYYQ